MQSYTLTMYKCSLYHFCVLLMLIINLLRTHNCLKKKKKTLKCLAEQNNHLGLSGDYKIVFAVDRTNWKSY